MKEFPRGRPWLANGPVNERVQCPACGVRLENCDCTQYDLQDAATEIRERSELKRLKQKYE